MLSYLGEFVLPTPTNTSLTLNNNGRGNSKVHFYLETINTDTGEITYEWDATGLVSGSGSFSLTDKYDGFHYAYYSSYARSDAPKTVNVNNMNKIGTGTTKVSYSNNLQLAFSRKTFELSFYNVVDKEKYSTGDFKPEMVKYGTSISQQLRNLQTKTPSIKDTNYTWDGKFYEDSSCEHEVDIGNAIMPDHAKTYYLKFELPKCHVSFDLNDTDEGSTAGVRTHPATYKADTEYDRDNIVVYRTNTISEIILTDAGVLKDEFTPQREGYTFLGWYYLKDQKEETKFIESKGIMEDLELYAKWRSNTLTDVGTINVYYRYTNPETGEVIQLGSKVMKDIPVGTRTELTAENFDEYYPQTSVKYYVIRTADSDNTVVFNYYRVEPWHYTIEYYITYDSYVSTDGVNVGDLSTTPFNERLTSVAKEANNQYETVEFSMPAGYKGYTLDHYEYADVTYQNSVVAIIHNGTDSKYKVLKFYIKPNTATLAIQDRYVVYNGESLAIPNETRALPSGFKVPENQIKKVDGQDHQFSYSGQLKNYYTYYDMLTQNLIPEDQRVTIKNAGTYRMNGYVVLEITETDETANTSTSYRYLMWKDVSKTLNLRINPRPLTVTSGSATQRYSPNSPLVCDTITVTGPSDGKGPFIGDDEKRYRFIFTVEAFRLDVGTSMNSFTYEVQKKDSSDTADLAQVARNYKITTKFGTLTVTQ